MNVFIGVNGIIVLTHFDIDSTDVLKDLESKRKETIIRKQLKRVMVNIFILPSLSLTSSSCVCLVSGQEPFCNSL